MGGAAGGETDGVSSPTLLDGLSDGWADPVQEVKNDIQNVSCL